MSENIALLTIAAMAGSAGYLAGWLHAKRYFCRPHRPDLLELVEAANEQPMGEVVPFPPTGSQSESRASDQSP